MNTLSVKPFSADHSGLLSKTDTLVQQYGRRATPVAGSARSKCVFGWDERAKYSQPLQRVDAAPLGKGSRGCSVRHKP